MISGGEISLTGSEVLLALTEETLWHDGDLGGGLLLDQGSVGVEVHQHHWILDQSLEDSGLDCFKLSLGESVHVKT